MKKATYSFLIGLLSLVAAIEICVCLFIPDWAFDGGLAGGAIAGAIAVTGLLITAVSFVVLISISLVLGLFMEKQIIVWLYLALCIVFLPAWGVVQYNRQQGGNTGLKQTDTEKAKIEIQLQGDALEQNTNN